MDFTLIETFRWQPDGGFLRLDQHLRRLSRSADALGFRQPVDTMARLKALETGEIGRASCRERVSIDV